MVNGILMILDLEYIATLMNSGRLSFVRFLGPAFRNGHRLYQMISLPLLFVRTN